MRPVKESHRPQRPGKAAVLIIACARRPNQAPIGARICQARLDVPGERK